MTSDVGIPVLAPGGVGSVLVKLMVRLPGGTVITTGDQLLPAAGFAAAQLAPLAAPVQVYPHMGTV